MVVSHKAGVTMLEDKLGDVVIHTCMTAKEGQGLLELD